MKWNIYFLTLVAFTFLTSCTKEESEGNGIDPWRYLDKERKTETTITVPQFNKDHLIDNFRFVKEQDDDYNISDLFTSKNFGSSTDELAPGEKYNVEIYPVKNRITADTLMLIFEQLNTLFVGGNSLVILHNEIPDFIPNNKALFMHDFKEMLPFDGSYVIIPTIAKRGEEWEFWFHFWDAPKEPDELFYILCISKT